MDLYALNEQETVQYLKDNFYPDLMATGRGYISDDSESWIMIKCVPSHYDSMIIELEDYDHITNFASINGYAPLYMVVTPEKIYEFNLNMHTLEWIERFLPSTSEPSTGRGLVAYLPVENAKELSMNLDELEEDIWDYDLDYDDEDLIGMYDDMESYIEEYREDMYVDPNEVEEL